MNPNDIQHFREYFLKPGFIFVSRRPTLISAVLGSCVSVCIRDVRQQYGGMNHFLYPITGDPSQATARYGNVATKALVRFFIEGGSLPEHLEAQIFGGAVPAGSGFEAEQIGSQNILMARRILEKSNIRIVSEDIGGNKGRKLVYNSHTNQVLIVRVDMLRRGDWFPYEGRRDE